MAVVYIYSRENQDIAEYLRGSSKNFSRQTTCHIIPVRGCLEDGMV